MPGSKGFFLLYAQSDRLAVDAAAVKEGLPRSILIRRVISEYIRAHHPDLLHLERAPPQVSLCFLCRRPLHLKNRSHFCRICTRRYAIKFLRKKFAAELAALKKKGVP